MCPEVWVSQGCFLPRPLLGVDTAISPGPHVIVPLYVGVLLSSHKGTDWIRTHPSDLILS